MAYLLAVDLGTTFTAAAVANGSRPTMVGLGNRALQVPTVLFCTGNGFLVGETAERRGLTEPDRLVREFKRRLGDDVPVVVDGEAFTPEALMAGMLAWVVDRTSERMGERPEGLVLTHPASWHEHKLERLWSVVDGARAPQARFCPEPTAAAAQYASRARVRPGDRLAVYDLGGGTFDACVLEQTAAGFRVLGTPEGVEQLGGVDFDGLLFGHVLGVLRDQVPELDPDDHAVTSALRRLRRECVDAKEALSSDVETSVPVALPGLVTSVRVTRAELEDLVREPVEQSIEAMARALRWAAVEPSELRAIILVGGSSRIPLVGELLQAAFGVPVALDTHPKHDVALGALRALAPARADARQPADRRGLPGRPDGARVAVRQPAKPSQTRPPSTAAVPGTPRETGRAVRPPGARRRVATVLMALLVATCLVAVVVLLERAGRRPPVPVSAGSSASTDPTDATDSAASPGPTPCGAVDELDGPVLDPAWTRTRSDAPVRFDGGLAVLGAPEGADLYKDRVSAAMLLRQVSGDFAIETLVRAAPGQVYQGAGLVLRSGRRDYVRLELGYVQVRGLAFEYQVGGPHRRVRSPRRGPRLVATSADLVVLRLSRTGRTVGAAWRPATEPALRELGSITVDLPRTIGAGVSVLNRAQGEARARSFEAGFDRVVISC